VCASLGPSLCYYHCWTGSGGRGGYSWEGDAILDALDTRLPSSGLELLNPIALPSEALLEIGLATEPLNAHSIDSSTSTNDSTFPTDDTMRSYNDDSQSKSNNTAGGTLDSGDSYQPCSSQSLSSWSTNDELSDLANCQLQFPFPFGKESSATTPMESLPPAAIPTEMERCNFKGCNRLFEDHESLRQHRRCHKKDLSCPEKACSKVFSTNRDLLRHQKSVHQKQSLPCPHCHKKFSGNRKDNLKRHIRKHHKENRNI